MMKMKYAKICGVVLSAVCCFSILSSCASKKAAESAPTEMPADSAENEAENEGVSSSGEDNLGAFTMQDLAGETYTQEMFADYDLTMVNIFATWCSPCVEEIPALQKLRDEAAAKNVNIIGIVLDVESPSDQTMIETAKGLAEQTGASYPFLIPDEAMLNGRLLSIDSIPETLFVDKEGNVVGSYVGSRSFEDWSAIVETELSNLKGE